MLISFWNASNVCLLLLWFCHFCLTKLSRKDVQIVPTSIIPPPTPKTLLLSYIILSVFYLLLIPEQYHYEKATSQAKSYLFCKGLPMGRYPTRHCRFSMVWNEPESWKGMGVPLKSWTSLEKDGLHGSPPWIRMAYMEVLSG